MEIQAIVAVVDCVVMMLSVINFQFSLQFYRVVLVLGDSSIVKDHVGAGTG